jgi:glutathione reductase (NADPH)
VLRDDSDGRGGLDFDVFVIGGGSGGVRAGRIAASLGARVGLCESARMGGTCVNLGCVPKKLMVYASRFADSFEDAEGFGWQVGSREHSWDQLVANKDRELERLNRIYEGMLERAGVQLCWGRGVITGPHTVQVGAQTYTAERILIATGSRSWKPDLPGVEYAITSDEAFGLGALPRRVLLVGGGYISVEFAGIFLGCGAEVDIVHRGSALLRGFDGDLQSHLQTELEARGIGLHLNMEIRGIRKVTAGLEVELSDGSTRGADCVLFATGRLPNTEGLIEGGLDVELSERGAVQVNAQFQSSVESIYAVGDVIERAQLTPVALAEGMWLAHHLFGEPRAPVAYDNIPTAVFSTPSVATVGMSEERARGTGERITIYRSTFRPMVHTLSGRQERNLMKLVVRDRDQRVLGCHMVGENAAEIIQGLAVALTCGATKQQFDATLGIHPSAAEEFVTMRTPVAS